MALFFKHFKYFSKTNKDFINFTGWYDIIWKWKRIVRKNPKQSKLFSANLPSGSEAIGSAGIFKFFLKSNIKITQNIPSASFINFLTLFLQRSPIPTYFIERNKFEEFFIQIASFSREWVLSSSWEELIGSSLPCWYFLLFWEKKSRSHFPWFWRL